MALLSLAVLIIGAATVLLLLKIGYLAFFHPLAKYPGPFLAKFTSFYAAYHGWMGDIHLDIWRCHQRYGDHVRYGPNKLLFCTAEALKDIYSTGTQSNFVKADSYTPLIHRSPNILTIRGGKEHARRRRIMAQGVSEKAQRGYEKRIAVHIDRLCKIVYSKTEAINISDWCYYLLFDIMSDVVFGARYNLLENDEFRYVPDAINKSNVRMSTLFQFPQLASFKWTKYLFRDAIAARNQFVPFVSRVVKERLRRQKMISDKKDEVTDVFANLAASEDPETGDTFTDNEIAAESTTLIVAGSDTTSTALSGLFFYLANNPIARAKATAEVRAKFSSRNDIIMGAALGSCTYLRACVDEAMRMSPPVGVPLWRRVRSDATIDSLVVEAGSDVGMSIYTMHHDPRYFEEPFEYKPDRWLANDKAIERARSVFNPFSIGSRACLGKGLAMTELLLTMATILFHGDFELAAGDLGKLGRGSRAGPYGRHRENEYQLWDFITGQRRGPILQFSSRTV
ncbi:hypothetical protein AYL99_01793 [Fonsecaea erecta]|uniref:Cytochrome P450 monooxygenase n=1 Tax=Fonsecaea erecta TaxID=1367422 RepID=A0A178ZT23_9EURO|nr:hypothetical protein AYL99_01793 [Fonsecaea erecta]OAP62566.1 hypothetical protein AYL99_01793 [Fonsecaea erecta]